MAGNKEPPRKYYVYVVEAKDNRGKRIFYVGQSGKTPEERLKDHKARCVKYCDSCHCRHYIHGTIIGLRYELFSQYNPLWSRREAEDVERWLARKLKRAGYAVRGGH